MSGPVIPTLLRSGELIRPPYFTFMQQVVDVLQTHELHILKLEPEFYEQFSCSGCGQCCQRPWWITITKEYYDRWYTEFDKHPSGQYKQPFEIRSEGDASNYADIRRKPGNHECLFLMDDRRCFVHANYGENALSPVCQQYPRYEGWYGSFLGRFMHNSCPDVENLIQTFPQIRYFIGTITQEKFASFQTLSHPLGLYQGYLWLGLQMDLLQDSVLSPVQALRCLGQAIVENFDLGPTPPSMDLLMSMHQSLRQQTVTAPKPVPTRGQPPMAFDCLHWILSPYESLQTYLGEIQAGWRAMPSLNPSEQKLLNDYLKRYLAYRIMTMNYFATEQLLLFYPAYFLLAANVAVLQWLAVYYRDREGVELNHEQLLRASTLVGFRFEHATQLIETIRKMTPEACLAGMHNLLCFDFGAKP